MAKKKKSNPLRSARGGRGVDDAKDIWFRKSSTGSALFLRYYAAQPLGTVCCCSATAEGHSASPDATKNQKRGMSRAAQRKRKRRKIHTRNDAPVEDESSSALVVAPSVVTKTTTAALPPDKPSHLWNTWKELRSSFEIVRRRDMESFVQSMSCRLPVTLRIRSTADADAVRQFQAGTSPLFAPLRTDILQAPFSKEKLPQEVKERLLHYSTHGVIARQELGSMLPILALEEEQQNASSSKAAVLDMCASPGSKTLQAWECLETTHRGGTQQFLLVANDVHQRRLDAMQEAIQRSGLAPRNITYTCQDATQFTLRTVSGKSQLFDRILCDVPCSGDGTCRKDRHILPQWKPDISNRLHSTQLAILNRGLALLRPGSGRLCYSTCSLNPVENEAVVATALQQNPNCELVQAHIQGVQLRDGLTGGWKVAQFSDESDSGLEWLDRPTADAKQQNADTPSTLWPPLCDMPCLSLCKRLWPQDQDSGGFFLALFRHRNSTIRT